MQQFIVTEMGTGIAYQPKEYLGVRTRKDWEAWADTLKKTHPDKDFVLYECTMCYSTKTLADRWSK